MSKMFWQKLPLRVVCAKKNRCFFFLVVWLFRFVAAPDEWLWQSNGAARTWRRSPWRSTRRRGRRSCRGREDRSDAARHRTGAAPRTRELLRVAGLEVEGDSCNILWQSPPGFGGSDSFWKGKKMKDNGMNTWASLLNKNHRNRSSQEPGLIRESRLEFLSGLPSALRLVHLRKLSWKRFHLWTKGGNQTMSQLLPKRIRWEKLKILPKNSDPKFNPSPKENRKKSRKPMKTLSSPNLLPLAGSSKDSASRFGYGLRSPEKLSGNTP